MPARTGSRRQRLWICRFAWTTQTRCPHTHSRRKSSSRKLLDLKDKGRRDYTLTSAIPGPSSGVHFIEERGQRPQDVWPLIGTLNWPVKRTPGYYRPRDNMFTNKTAGPVRKFRDDVRIAA